MVSEGIEVYVEFLEQLRHELLKKNSFVQIGQISGDDFEELTFSTALSMLETSNPHGISIYRTPAAAFPDLVINDTFGVEVKATVKDHWNTLGNSVNESRRIASVDTVYFFFGKLGGEFDVKVKPYEACLKNIATTHYPRYVVDMDLPTGESIFEKLNLTYEQYRNLSGSERIKILREFLKAHLEEGDAVWWLDDTTTPPVIHNFNRFSDSRKTRFLCLSLILCPEVFGGSRERGKYDKVAQLLLRQEMAVTGNLRDHFSAGGIDIVDLTDGTQWAMPRIVVHLVRQAKTIRSLLADCNEQELCEAWGVEIISADREEQYAKILDSMGEKTVDGRPLGDFIRFAP